jgi:DNA-binding MarR family transcriptional regulator/GNAT superfamily N-acetyltransferase
MQSPVEAVRAFNRFYTTQIGVLREGLLGSSFSLTQVRVLYEIAHREKCTAAALCGDLGLDPGYLSRMLRGFEARKLIARQASSKDRRQSLLRLTSAGRRVFQKLDTRQDREVGRLLDRLTPRRQKDLVHSLQVAQQIMSQPSESTASYRLRSFRPGDMGWVVHRHGELYFQEEGYDERFEGLVAKIVGEFIENFDPKCERCWIAEKDGEIAGFIFLVRKSATVCKLRLLLVEPWARGLGLGRRLIAECIAFARDAGFKKMMLWTQSDLLPARKLYKDAGFKLVAKEPHSSWGRKDLVSETWELYLEKSDPK